MIFQIVKAGCALLITNFLPLTGNNLIISSVLQSSPETNVAYKNLTS